MKKHKIMHVYNAFLSSVPNFKWSLEIIQLMRTVAHGSPAEFLISSCIFSYFLPPAPILCPAISILILVPLSGIFFIFPWGNSVPVFPLSQGSWKNRLVKNEIMLLFSPGKISDGAYGLLRSACSWIDPAPAAL